MTIRELIERSHARLQQAGVAFGHGTTNAFDEAVWLVLWRLGLPLDDLDGVADREVTVTQRAQIETLLDQRITTRRPAAYLTREAWLQGVPFYVDERAIVPRSFIAELLANGRIDPWLDTSTRRALDLCTGNGSLAVLMAMVYPELQVDAADISTQALEVARINVERHHLQQQVRLMTCDGLAGVQGPYDLIVCNPPYVPSASMRSLPPEYAAEPALALAGGADGMDFIRPLLAGAARHMTAQAVLVLEVGHERAAFERAFPRLEVTWLSTSAGDDQVLLVERSALASRQEAAS